MRSQQRIEAIIELADKLTAKELRTVTENLDDLADEKAKAECERDGHQIDNDHCGKPEHRFCRHCYQRETTIENSRQAKANEATDSKSVLLGESPGSGSNIS